MCVHIPFIGKCQRRGSALSLQYLLHACWEWIAATVQATRLHLEIELSRGGTVVAISLSTMCMQRAACLSVVLVASQNTEFVHVGFPPHTTNFSTTPLPTQSELFKALVFHLHISWHFINEHGGGGCMGQLQRQIAATVQAIPSWP